MLSSAVRPEHVSWERQHDALKYFNFSTGLYMCQSNRVADYDAANAPPCMHCAACQVTTVLCPR